MDRYSWKEIVRKTKWASGKKSFTKRELCDLMNNAMTLEKFMQQNKSEFKDANRNDRPSRCLGVRVI